MAKLAKDMTDDEFNEYCDEVCQKIKEILPKDLLISITLASTNGLQNYFKTNMQIEGAFVLMEAITQQLGQKIKEKIQTN